MKNFRILVLILLLSLATPFLIHYRTWASGFSLKTKDQSAATIMTAAGNSQSANLPSLPQPPAGLPNGNSSLPLLSVIGFGILVGGVLSALRTRHVHK